MIRKHQIRNRGLRTLAAAAVLFAGASPAGAATPGTAHEAAPHAQAAQASPFQASPFQTSVRQDAIPDGLTVSLMGDAPAMATAESTYAVMVEALATVESFDKASVTLAVTTAPLTTSADLSSFMTAPDSVQTRPVAEVPTRGPLGEGRIGVDAPVTTSLTVAPGGLGLPVDVPGVYGTVVSLVLDGEPVWASAAPVTWEPASLPAIEVGVIASISGSEDRVNALLRAAGDDRIALAIDPAATSVLALSSMRARDVSALVAGNLDVSAIAHAERGEVLDAAVERTREVTELDMIAVLSSADDASVAMARDAGVGLVVIDSRWTGDVGSTAPVVEVDPGGGPVRAVVTNGALSNALASAGPNSPTGVARLIAEAALASQSGTTTAIASPGDAWLVEGTRDSRAVAALWNAPFVAPVRAQDLITAAQVPQLDLPDLVESPIDPTPGAVGAVSSALARIAVMEQATDEPSRMLRELGDGLFAALAVGNRADVDRRDTVVSDALGATASSLGSVTVTSGSSLLLVSSTGDVPVTVANGLDVPVTLTVAMISRSPILVIRDTPSITVPAGSEATVTVPVTAVSSGDVSVSLALRTPEDQVVSFADALHVTVRAEWGSTATWVFTAGLVVLLIAGVARTIKRGRRETRLGPIAEESVAGAASSDA